MLFHFKLVDTYKKKNKVLFTTAIYILQKFLVKFMVVLKC